MIVELAKSGKAILLITSELPELMDLSDVVHVLRRGQIVKSFQRSEFSEKNILSEATALTV